MKRIIFIRHGYLEGKFDDYSKLLFEDIEKLLIRELCPNINYEKTKFLLEEKTLLQEIDMIISSQENRSIQTAKIIQELNPVHHIISSNLNEIKFRRGIIEKEDIEQEDFHYLRKKILTSIYNSNFSEKFYDVKNRFLKFLEFTKTIEHDNILCVTHGWFMRIIELYKEKGSLENINLNELLEVRPAKFLDTIEIHPL